jgi:predicted PurR-regulated permease PerM
VLPDRQGRLTILRTLNDIDDHMTRYFGTFTIINVGLGFLTAGLTWMVGLPNRLLWGVLAALLNFVPYLGPTTVTATLLVIGVLVYPTFAEAVLPPFLFPALVTVVGQFLTRTLMVQGSSSTPSPSFLGLLFAPGCGARLGPSLPYPFISLCRSPSGMPSATRTRT